MVIMKKIRRLMRNNKILILLSAFLMIFAGTGLSMFAYAEGSDKAATTSTLTVSPMYQRLILTPGEKYEGMIEVTNPAFSTTDLGYKVSVGSFSQHASENSLDDYDTVDIETINDYNQIVNWIEIDEDTGSVEPNGVRAVNFVIDVPMNAPAGGQYASLLVMKTNTQESAASSGFSIQDQAQVASIIYAEVAGQTVRKGAILENNIPSFLLDNPLTATSMVQNNGNVHTDAEYILQVWPIFSDEEICTNEENAFTNLVMPDTKLYHQETCNLPLVGIFRAKQTVRIFGEESIVEKTVVVCPLWLMLVVVFAIVGIIVWIVIRVKMRKKAEE